MIGSARVFVRPLLVGRTGIVAAYKYKAVVSDLNEPSADRIGRIEQGFPDVSRPIKMGGNTHDLFAVEILVKDYFGTHKTQARKTLAQDLGDDFPDCLFSRHFNSLAPLLCRSGLIRSIPPPESGCRAA